MAEKRMFAQSVIDSDMFLEMPATSQCLYFHLAMRADDDGFINKPKSIMRMVGAKDDDINVLISKNFIKPFESGVVVVTHWKIHNNVRKDMYKPTVYQHEMQCLTVGKSGIYEYCSASDTIPIHDCTEPVTESIQNSNIDKDRLDKDRLDKNRIENIEEKEEKKKKTASRFSPPSLDEVKAYCVERKNSVDAEHFIDYYSSNGWKVGKNSMKDWKAAVRNWEKNGYSNSSNKGGDFVDQYGRINFGASHFDENDPTVF
ncbi:hypothetical protein [Treponema sp.]|uniref:hypothetical protein n=1 Tax=Treponema sp. TaxID=166 RepID=UPI00388F7B46